MRYPSIPSAHLSLFGDSLCFFPHSLKKLTLPHLSWTYSARPLNPPSSQVFSSLLCQDWTKDLLWILENPVVIIHFSSSSGSAPSYLPLPPGWWWCTAMSVSTVLKDERIAHTPQSTGQTNMIRYSSNSLMVIDTHSHLIMFTNPTPSARIQTFFRACRHNPQALLS